MIILFLLIVLVGCTKIEPKYLDDQYFCESDEDCHRFCCSSCGNKYWVKENINPEMECCYIPEEGPVSGCSCINNRCQQIFENR